MSIRKILRDRQPTRRTATLVAVIVAAAIVTRFTGLDRKFFWADETQTAYFTAGSTVEDVRLTIYDSRPHSRAEVMVHQFPRPDHSAADTVRALATDDPKNPPLYFVTARAWMNLCSPTIAGLRSWSAMLSVVALAFAFLLARDLAEDNVAGWIAVAVLAASPLHQVYAQEGRQYMCWVVFVLASSWLLLGAVRRTREGEDRSGWWFALYAVSLTMALYSHLLTALVAGAHATWVVVAERFRVTRVVRRTSVAMATSGLLFSPWALVVLRDTREHPAWNPWSAAPISWGEWLQRVVGGFSNAFTDVDSSWLLFRDQKLAVILLLVAAWLVVITFRSQSRDSRWFLALLALTCSVPFAAADLLDGGQRATVIRYQLPAVLAMEIAVAIGLACLLRSPTASRRLAGVCAGILFVASGFISVFQYQSAGEFWWNKNSAVEVLSAAEIINRSPSPLVVSSVPSRNPLKMFTMVHPLGDHVRILMTDGGRRPTIPDAQHELFLWNVAPGLRGEFKRQGWREQEVGPPDLYLATRRLHDDVNEFKIKNSKFKIEDTGSSYPQTLP